MAKRQSQWTSLYWDKSPDGSGLRAYVRLAPRSMDVGAAGFPHGLSVGTSSFSTEEDAAAFADAVDRFMDALAAPPADRDMVPPRLPKAGFRYALASARRLYLHWTQAQKPDPVRLKGDLERILAGYECAVDEIDDLHARLAKLQGELAKTQEELADMQGEKGRRAEKP